MTRNRFKPDFFKRKTVKALLIVTVALITIRLILPYVVLHYANKSLSSMKGYFGKVKDIDLALFRGAYKINNIYIHKKDTLTQEESEFFEAQIVDLSIHWGALLNGKIVGELELEDPVLVFTKDKVEPKEVKKDTTDFKKILDDFMPLRINRFEIHNGVIKYKDHTSSPPVNIYMSNTYVKAENLTNVKAAAVLPSTVIASAEVYEGTLDINIQLDPLAKSPTFDINAELKNTNLAKLNEFFKAYGKFDVNRGIFGLFVEGAAKNGKFVGYFKPVIKDLDIIGPEDKDDNILRMFWEGAIGTTGVIFRNQKHDQVATKVPIEGTFSNTSINVWYAVIDVLRNAFVQALQPAIDRDINIHTVEGPQAKHSEKTNKDKNNNATENKNRNHQEKKEKKGLFKKVFSKDKSDENNKSDKNDKK